MASKVERGEREQHNDGMIVMRHNMPPFCAVRTPATSLRIRVALLILACGTIMVSHLHAQVPRSTENNANINRSVDAALNSAIPVKAPSSRYGYISALFVTNRTVALDAIQKAADNGQVWGYEDVFMNIPNVGVSYGTVKISYPINRRKGDTNYGLSSTLQNPLYQFSIAEHYVAGSPEEFRGLILREYSQNNGKGLIYIHGLDNTFSDAAERVAQLALDLEYKGGIPLFFSWPSDAARLNRYLPYTTVFEPQYKEVVKISINSRQYAMLAMDELADAVKGPFDTLAHSMGTDIAAHAIVFRSVRRNSGSSRPNPHSIILAAPDMSTNDFIKLRPAIVRPGLHVVVYCSNDRALRMSRMYNGSDERLGFCATTEKPPMPGIDLVSVKGVISDFMRHSYYLSAVQILEDIQGAMSDQQSESNKPRVVAPVAVQHREIVLH